MTAAISNVSRVNRRFVLLGASNAARGIGAAVQAARTLFDGPFDLLAALGHGRSYGRGAWVLGRWLPGIVDCGLWKDLAQREEEDPLDLPTQALVTDVGNDILYGASAERIAEWVGTCIERLQTHSSEITLTGIPIQSLDRITEWEFPIFRTMLYPGCRLTRTEALSRAAELNDLLREIADANSLTFVKPQADWYGRDRIHIGRAAQRQAWQTFLAEDESGAEAPPSSWREFLAIRTLTPHHRRLFGFSQRRSQPAATLRDGTQVSLY